MIQKFDEFINESIKIDKTDRVFSTFDELKSILPNIIGKKRASNSIYDKYYEKLFKHNLNLIDSFILSGKGNYASMYVKLKNVDSYILIYLDDEMSNILYLYNSAFEKGNISVNIYKLDNWEDIVNQFINGNIEFAYNAVASATISNKYNLLYKRLNNSKKELFKGFEDLPKYQEIELEFDNFLLKIKNLK